MAASADAGIAFYRPLDANMRLTVFSSGKVAQYLHARLPVIANDFPETRKVFDGYGAGICIKEPSELAHALRTLALNYSELRAGATRLFKDYYDFDSYYPAIFQELAATSQSGRAFRE